MSIAKHYVVVAAVAVLIHPMFLSAQKPAKPPAPGGAANPAIAYEARATNGFYDLMVMDANGQNQTRLVRGGDNLTASWSPDGEWIAFARTSITSPGIYMIRRNGTGLCRIVETSGLRRDGAPAWSPQRTSSGHYKIVYGERAGGQTTDLFGVDAVCGATTPQRLTDTPGLYELQPAWSTDNVLAAAVGAVEMDVQLFDIVVDNLGAMTLTPGLNLTSVGPLAGGDVFGPTWTQDRANLVVAGSGTLSNGSPKYTPDLWLISASSPGVAVQLSNTTNFLERRASWSPDFTKLVFDANGGIYTAAFNATDSSLSQATLLLNPKQGSVGHPSWRPVQ